MSGSTLDAMAEAGKVVAATVEAEAPPTAVSEVPGEAHAAAGSAVADGPSDMRAEASVEANAEVGADTVDAVAMVDAMAVQQIADAPAQSA